MFSNVEDLRQLDIFKPSALLCASARLEDYCAFSVYALYRETSLLQKSHSFDSYAPGTHLAGHQLLRPLRGLFSTPSNN